ncbi:hypothetical protein R1sor_016254 [Riccia sorocarpa]|uniref:Replitron HUH endonuclease domain-containing protein n=1 Tax=Riccia sorocarpa TaxID=122646 RepID=A0ABD3HIL0_9MARC
MGVLALQRGDSHLQLHVQGLLRITTSSARALKAEIRNTIGWEEAGPLGGSICVKSLKYKGLHTIIGIIGYCLKDEGQEHFRFYSKNVSEDQKREGRRMHAIYGASEYKNRLELSPANILGRALQFRRAERLWRACTTPESVEVPDVENIIFGIDTPARYFEANKTTKLEADESDPLSEIEESELPADDPNVDIPVVELERTADSGADLDRVQEALLEAGFAVGQKTNEEQRTSADLPDYIRLW